MIQQTTLTIETPGRGLLDITQDIDQSLQSIEADAGLCHIFIQHTSASLCISENADPDVLKDLEYYMTQAVRDADPHYQHVLEGPDDMASHIRSVLTSTDLTVPFREKHLQLGTWQAVYLWEHRYKSYQRKLFLTTMC